MFDVEREKTTRHIFYYDSTMLPKHSLAFAQLSNAAYLPWDQVRYEVLKYGYNYIQHWDHGESQAVLVCNEEHYVLVFRGTEFTIGSVRDILSNLSTLEPWAGTGQVHTGYISHFNRIRDIVHNYIAQLPLPVYVAGHSMGGALAVLYAAWRPFSVISVYTYGTPRIGDREFISSLDKVPVEAHINSFDFAPHIPLSIRGFLRAATNTFHLDSGGWIGPVTRHSIRRYIKAIKKGTI